MRQRTDRARGKHSPHPHNNPVALVPPRSVVGRVPAPCSSPMQSCVVASPQRSTIYQFRLHAYSLHHQRRAFSEACKECVARRHEMSDPPPTGRSGTRLARSNRSIWTLRSSSSEEAILPAGTPNSALHSIFFFDFLPVRLTGDDAAEDVRTLPLSELSLDIISRRSAPEGPTRFSPSDASSSSLQTAFMRSHDSSPSVSGSPRR